MSIQVSLAIVVSLDGRITDRDGRGPNEWASSEDQQEFARQKKRHDWIVMGSATYEAVRDRLRPTPKKPRIVLTRTPQKYAEDQTPGLDFWDVSPKEMVARAQQAGCTSLLLVGGADTSARFFDADLVDDVFVTIEPLLLGGGLPLTAPLAQAVTLELVDSKQLNNQGTLVLHYRVC